MDNNVATSSFSDAMRALRTEQENCGQPCADYVLQVLRGLANPSEFERLLKQLLRNDEFLAQAATVSYHHPLGFDPQG